MDRKKKKRRWLRFAALLAAVCTAAIALYRVGVERRLDALVAALEAKGYPMTLEALEAFYPEIPHERNAAPIYLKAFDTIAPVRFNADAEIPLRSGSLPAPWAALDQTTLTVYAAYVEANAEALNLLREPAEYESCRYPARLSWGLDARLPHLARVREASTLLAAKILIDVESGEVESALRGIEDLLALCRSLEGEPYGLSQLVRHVCLRRAAEIVLRVQHRANLSGEQLAELQRMLAARDKPGLMHRAMMAETAMQYRMLTGGPDVPDPERRTALGRSLFGDEIQFLLYKHWPWTGALFEWTLGVSGVKSHNVVKLVDVSSLLVDTLDEDYAQGDYERARLIEMNREYGPRITSGYLRYHVAYFPGVAAAEGELLARLRLAYTALAIERFHRAEERFPYEIAELAPKYLDQPPMDPLGNGP